MTAIGRFIRLAGHITRSNVAEPPYPYRLTYAVTNRCQAHCVMCNIWQKPVDDELSLAEIDKLFARANRFSWINLTGGEIFQRPDINDIIRVISGHCRNLCLLNFPTNGFRTDEIVAAVEMILEELPVPRLMVTVSIDGPRELHDRIRNLPGSWERGLATFRQLRKLRSRRFSTYLGYTLQQANLQAFPDTLAACRQELGELSVNDIHVNLAHISGHYYTNAGFRGAPTPREAGQLLAEISAARQQQWYDPVAFLERRYQRLANTYLENGTPPLTCQAAAASCFLDPAGVVFPCSGFTAPLGSVREHSFDLYRIWNSPERLRIRQQVRNGACPGCWTPCEAYQTILAHLLTPTRKRP